MRKVNKRLIQVFAHAAALQQSGRLRNTVYCIGKFVYILNQDHTILLKFNLRQTENARGLAFDHPISFHANDYDSDTFYEKDGMVAFVQKSGDWTREKVCRTPEFEPKEIKRLYKKFLTERKRKGTPIKLGQSFINLLDQDLSHIEFSGKKHNLITIQRNIYSGAVRSIVYRAKHLGEVPKVRNFKPIGIRTNDFLALYSFSQDVDFWFGTKKVLWFESKSGQTPFTGFISNCTYDELGV